ncbi:MAG TPA: hypothetical protein VIP29_02345 [Nitrososphaeraceae archaeon]
MQTSILVVTVALSLVLSYPMMSLAQQQPQTGNQSSSQQKIDVPMNFSLKGQGDDDSNATEGGKDFTVTLKLQSSEGGSPMDFPLKAILSNDTQAQDLELCATLQGGEEMCQSLEDVVQAQGQNQSSGATANETSGASGNATDEDDEDDEDDGGN